MGCLGRIVFVGVLVCVRTEGYNDDNKTICAFPNEAQV